MPESQDSPLLDTTSLSTFQWQRMCQKAWKPEWWSQSESPLRDNGLLTQSCCGKYTFPWQCRTDHCGTTVCWTHSRGNRYADDNRETVQRVFCFWSAPSYKMKFIQSQTRGRHLCMLLTLLSTCPFQGHFFLYLHLSLVPSLCPCAQLATPVFCDPFLTSASI
jgi:hypothetical protein